MTRKMLELSGESSTVDDLKATKMIASFINTYYHGQDTPLHGIPNHAPLSLCKRSVDWGPGTSGSNYSSSGTRNPVSNIVDGAL